MLKVWGRRSSVNVQKVLWLADELGLDCRNVELGGRFGGLDDPAFLAMNPHGRVPVIDDGGTVVWESHAILRYLAARYGSGGFRQEDPGARARVEQWMDWAQTSLQPDFLNGVFWGWYRTPEARRDMPAVKARIGKCAAHMRLLDGTVGAGPFLLGDEPTLADIAVGTHLYRYFELEITRPAVPNVEAWYARLRERPAYRAHVMIPFEELKGRLEY